jgi:RES domain-containing protein
LTLQAWRIGLASARTAPDQAYGSTLFEGRWHTLRSGPQPRRVVYAASSRALAQLEKRVHANGVAPVNQALFRLDLPAGTNVGHAHELGLPPTWRSAIGISQAFGDAWLDAADALALWVPSFVEPGEDNMLINPAHADFQRIRLAVERDPFVFDPRLTSGVASTPARDGDT